MGTLPFAFAPYIKRGAKPRSNLSSAQRRPNPIRRPRPFSSGAVPPLYESRGEAPHQFLPRRWLDLTQGGPSIYRAQFRSEARTV